MTVRDATRTKQPTVFVHIPDTAGQCGSRARIHGLKNLTSGPGAAEASGREIMLMSDGDSPRTRLSAHRRAHRRAQRSSLNLITNHNHLKPEDMGIFGISSHRVRITLVGKYCYSTRRFRRLHLGRLTALRPRWHYEKTFQSSDGPRWSSG